MIQNRSFTEYVAKQFYNELYEAINNYLQENKDDIDLRLYRVKNIDTINLADITVKFVDISDLPVMAIEFDVAVEAEIEVHERDYHYDETEECRQWFMLHCTGDLDCKLKDFAISSRGMKQVEVVRAMQLIGVSMTRETYVKIERGIQHISASQLRAIKEALNTTYDELLM